MRRLAVFVLPSSYLVVIIAIEPGAGLLIMRPARSVTVSLTAIRSAPETESRPAGWRPEELEMPSTV